MYKNCQFSPPMHSLNVSIVATNNTPVRASYYFPNKAHIMAAFLVGSIKIHLYVLCDPSQTRWATLPQHRPYFPIPSSLPTLFFLECLPLLRLYAGDQISDLTLGTYHSPPHFLFSMELHIKASTSSTAPWKPWDSGDPFVAYTPGNSCHCF